MGDKINRSKIETLSFTDYKNVHLKAIVNSVQVWNTGHDDQVNMTWSLKHNNKSDMSSHEAILPTIIDQRQ